MNSKEALARLAERDISVFTVEDLQETLEINRPSAHNLATKLEKSNLARRIKRCLYALTPPDHWLAPSSLPTNWYLAASAVVQSQPHYLSHYTAMEIHQMTQHPLRTVFVSVTHQRRDVRVQSILFRYVTVAEHRFFGAEPQFIDESPVQVSTLERTLIDGIDRPDLCGGLEEVYRGMRRRVSDVNTDRLLNYLRKLDQPVLTKRLGFMLELAGFGDWTALNEIQEIAGRLKRYVPLAKGKAFGKIPQSPQRDRRWELWINVDVDELRDSAVS